MARTGETGARTLSSKRRGVSGSLRLVIASVFLVSVAAIVALLSNLAETHHYSAFLTEAESISARNHAELNRRLVANLDMPSVTDTATGGSFSSDSQRDARNPLAIPPGRAPNLPSILVNDTAVDKKRNIYGGAGDKKHLGGFTEIDTDGISPSVWKHMIADYGVHSVIDVGCGRGLSTSWFLLHGADVLCVEGSHDAVERSVLPDPEKQVVEHDYSRGPWWPEKTYDAAWVVEFLEHVNLQYHFNYISTFRKAALIFATSSRWGGWHHVEVHPDAWWIRKFESYGLRYDAEMTEQVRAWAREERGKAPNGKPLRANHIIATMKVFVNPIVAALPEHAHLFPEFGCYQARLKNGTIVNKECGTGNRKAKLLETKLDPSFYPLKVTDDADREWDELIRNQLDSNAPV